MNSPERARSILSEMSKKKGPSFKGFLDWNAGADAFFRVLIRVLLLLLALLIVALIAGFVGAPKSDTCADWQADYRTILADFGEIGSDDWDDYPDIDPKDTNEIRREAVVRSLVELSDVDRRPEACRAP
jgi:hypothetical protein